jgi:hypothetical protein
LEQGIFIVAVLTLLTGVICAFYAALAYHRPPHLAGSAMPGTSGATSATTGRQPIPRRTIVLGTLSLLFVLITIFLMSQLRNVGSNGPQGPQGIQGPAGPQGEVGRPGPQGLAAVPDPRIDALIQQLAALQNKPSDRQTTQRLDDLMRVESAIAKAVWLDREIIKFDQFAKQYKDNTKAYLDQVKNPPRGPSMSGGGSIGTVDSAGQNITRIVKNTLGVDIDLNKTPRFDRNHHCCAPDEKDVENDRQREEYNRVTDQLQTGERTIDEFRQKLESDRAQHLTVIEEFAKRAP